MTLTSGRLLRRLLVIVTVLLTVALAVVLSVGADLADRSMNTVTSPGPYLAAASAESLVRTIDVVDLHAGAVVRSSVPFWPPRGCIRWRGGSRRSTRWPPQDSECLG